MAFASRPARSGLELSFRRMRQVLNCALARSPGPRSAACARLATRAMLKFRSGVESLVRAGWGA